MTRQAMLLAVLLAGMNAPVNAATPVDGAPQGGQAGGLFGTAVSVAMGAQGSIALIDRDRLGTRLSYRHRAAPRRAAARLAGAPPLDGVTFTADMPVDAAQSPAQGVSAQDLAAALTSR